MIERLFSQLLLCIFQHFLRKRCFRQRYAVHCYWLRVFHVLLAIEKGGCVAGDGSPAVGRGGVSHGTEARRCDEDGDFLDLEKEGNEQKRAKSAGGGVFVIIMLLTMMYVF